MHQMRKKLNFSTKSKLILMNCVSTFVVCHVGVQLQKEPENGCKKLKAIYCFQLVISLASFYGLLFLPSMTLFTVFIVWVVGRHKIADCKFVLSL